MIDYLTKIKETLRALPQGEAILAACEPVLSAEQFAYYPAAVFKHHAYYGGLVQHTYEVLQYALDFVRSIPSADHRVVAVAAVWHDFGKLYDYNVGFVDHDEMHLSDITYTSEAGMCGHLFHSAREFMEFSAGVRGSSSIPTDKKMLQAITHAIIAHHGRKEWGSPREPQTIEAIAVHSADVMSVMVNTGLNTSSRKETIIRPSSAYGISDIAVGDIVTASGRYAGVVQDEVSYRLLRLDKNNIPVCAPMGTTKVREVKIPLKSILYVQPGA